MSVDRFVYFKERKPTKIELSSVLQDYLSDVYSKFTDDGSRMIVKLPGAPSFPFKRVVKNPVPEAHTERWFEVYYASLDGRIDCCIDVITRQTDEFTDVVATGFATLVARYWRGEIQDGS